MTKQQFRDIILEQLNQDTMENVIQEIKIVCVNFGESNLPFKNYLTDPTPKEIQNLKERMQSIRALLNQAAIESRGI